MFIKSEGMYNAMQRYGFVRSELDIKTLILYILRRADMPITFETLTEMSMCDGALDYFELTGCLDSLFETGHVELSNGFYQITKKGRGNLEICESSLATSVLRNADETVDKIAFRLRREQYIDTEINKNEKDEYLFSCRLRDDTGEILSLEMKVPNKEQAKKLETGFKENAENIYNILLSALLETKD